jgi:peptidoglycan/xylan/chitin deacetylase (PgdA/CDA1 family)
VLDNAVPVLDEFGFSSTCYFVAQRLGQHNDWDAQLGIPATPLMDAAALQRWAASGHEVGSHTLDHVHLPAIERDAAWEQIDESKRLLEQIAGTTVESFCYPYGDASKAVQALVRDAGYSNATMTHRGRARQTDDRFDLPRVTVAGFTGTFRFLQKCLSGHEDRRRQRPG